MRDITPAYGFNIGSFGVAMRNDNNPVTLTIFKIGVHSHLFDVEGNDAIHDMCHFRFGIEFTVFNMSFAIGKFKRFN